MHMVFAYPNLIPQSLRNPCSAKSAEFSVGNCHDKCSKGAGHGKALFSSAREAIGILK